MRAPFVATVTARLDKSERDAIQRRADQELMTVSTWARRTLVMALREDAAKRARTDWEDK